MYDDDDFIERLDLEALYPDSFFVCLFLVNEFYG
jgi:hypothetical protein